MFRNEVPNNRRCIVAQSRYVVRTAGAPMYRFWTASSRGPGHTLLDAVCFKPNRFVEDLRLAAMLSTTSVSRQVLRALRADRPPPRLSQRADVQREYLRVLRRRYVHVKSQYYGVRNNIHRVALTNRIRSPGVRAAACTCQDSALGNSPCKHMLLINSWLTVLRPNIGLRW